MFVNLNERTLPITASSTPTAYRLPDTCIRLRIMNDAGATIVAKLETSSTSTLTAPSAGVAFQGSAIANQAVEIFNVNPESTHISIYSASGTGTVYIQETNGQ